MDFDIHVKHITWDTEVDGVVTYPDLPTSIPSYSVSIYDDTPVDEIDEEIGDALVNALSDVYGYCIYDVEWDVN